MKRNTITGEVSERVPDGVYEGIQWHGGVPADVAARAGWVDMTAAEVEAMDAAAATQAAIEAAAQEAADAERRSRPIVYDQPLECPMIVLQSHHLGKGIALVATDDLDIVPIVMHESPWPDKATADARIAGALAKRLGDRAAAKKDINGQIQKRLENIERLLGLRA